MTPRATRRAMTSRRHRVVCVLADGMTSIGAAIANDFFGAPGTEEVLGVPWYRYAICTADPSPIRVGVLHVNVQHGVGALSRADTVIIPARGTRPPSPELLAALARAHQRGARMVSFCTGAYVLAEAGLLDGRPATTLWTHTERFRARFPAARRPWIPARQPIAGPSASHRPPDQAAAQPRFHRMQSKERCHRTFG